jgi:hypothetical protein
MIFVAEVSSMLDVALKAVVAFVNCRVLLVVLLVSVTLWSPCAVPTVIPPMTIPFA